MNRSLIAYHQEYRSEAISRFEWDFLKITRADVTDVRKMHDAELQGVLDANPRKRERFHGADTDWGYFFWDYEGETNLKGLHRLLNQAEQREKAARYIPRVILRARKIIEILYYTILDKILELSGTPHY